LGGTQKQDSTLKPACGGFSSEDSKMPLALTSVPKVQEALAVFNDVRINDPLKMSGDEIQVHFLLTRWHQLDPEDFNRSSHAGSIVIRASEEAASAIER
jgi:hypothetical protein